MRVEHRPDPAILKPTDAITKPIPMGHEYCGIVEEIGSGVRTIKPGQFVAANIGTQAEFARIPLADGTLVATPEIPSEDMVAGLLC